MINTNNNLLNTNLVTAENSSALSMVNENRLLKVVKRLFNGSVKEVLGELLQNSQRAGAKNVIITTTADTITIADDGSGLAGNDVEKFATLMKIAESSYEREEVADQDPMGVGLFSLFALEGIKEVIISSAGLSMPVDTNRLWNEDGYWHLWRERLTHIGDGDKGLKLTISATEELIKRMKESFLSPISHTKYYDTELKSAVRGYTGVLEVFLDGELLDNTCEFAKQMDEVFLETEYQGNLLIIGADSFAHRNLINWYGQLINAGASHLRYYLEVRKGRPVNPMSPSRRGIIEDSDFKALKNFVVEKLREHILTKTLSEISELAIRTAYSNDLTWANSFCPYFTANRLKHSSSHSSFEDWTLSYTEKVVLSYTDQPIILDESVIVCLPDKQTGVYSESESISYGAQTFVPVIENVLEQNVYEICSGNSNRLDVLRVWWKPGAELENFFAETGEFALCKLTQTEMPADGWHNVGEETVFVFENSENWHINSVEWLIVGVKNDIRSKVGFLTNEAWSIWSYENEEYDSETMEKDFKQSLEAVKAGLFKDCLPDDCLELWKLKNYFPLENNERILSLEFIYPEKDAVFHPTGIKISTNFSRSVQKQFLSSAEAGLRA